MKAVIELILLTCIIPLLNARLLYTFNMVRHGALYPKKDFLGKIQDQLKAQITPIGMRQLYNLGTYLRADYMVKSKFLTQKFNHSQVEFFSSSLPRTQFSALSLMYGLYPLKEGEKISPRAHQSQFNIPYSPLFTKKLKTQPSHNFALNEGFQPIPLHQLDEILDSCTYYGKIFGVRQKQIQKQLNDLQLQYSLLMEKIKLLFKLPPNQVNIETMVDLFKSLQSYKLLGVQLPADFTQKDNQQLKYIQQYYSALLNQGKFGKILSTLILQFMREKLNNAVNDLTKKKMAFIVYHSSSMWPIMVNLNLTSSQCLNQKKNGKMLSNNTNCFIPDYAASLIIQLHEDDKLGKVIKMRFNGRYVPVCGGQQVCKYDEFIERVIKSQQDYDQYCGKRPLKGYVTPKG